MNIFSNPLPFNNHNIPLITKALLAEEAIKFLKTPSSWLGILYLDIVDFPLLEKFPENNPHNVAASFRLSAMKAIHQIIPPEQLVGSQSLWNDDLVIFFSLPRELSNEKLSKMAIALGRLVKDEMKQGLTDNQVTNIDLHTGYAQVASGSSCPETQLSIALKQAIVVAQQQPVLEDLERREDLLEIINYRLLHTVFQPLITLTNGEIMGFEALTRGPADSALYSPATLFPLAEQTGLLYKLEKTARELALTSLPRLSSDNKLFINTNPQVINDPEFVPGQTKKLIDNLGLSPRNIVFEITERTSIKDFASFRQTLEHYRNQGYLIAIDDAGAGYSSLQSIAELSPDYIKIDMSLIRDINNSIIKKALVETFVTFSKKINSTVIAEGIETAEELQTLIELDVPYGQGFYLGKTQPTF
ncbi:MAG: EAL domain-containing protein [Thermincolia bacterium]